MKDKLIITFDKSQEDISTLVVGREGWSLLNPAMEVINIITGEEAEMIWKRLKEKNNDR